MEVSGLLQNCYLISLYMGNDNSLESDMMHEQITKEKEYTQSYPKADIGVNRCHWNCGCSAPTDYINELLDLYVGNGDGKGNWDRESGIYCIITCLLCCSLLDWHRKGVSCLKLKTLCG